MFPKKNTKKKATSKPTPFGQPFGGKQAPPFGKKKAAMPRSIGDAGDNTGLKLPKSQSYMG